MKFTAFIVLSLLTSSFAFSQIYLEDSTAQVVGYWTVNEKYTYKVTNEKYKATDTDTTDKELWKYDVDITILDSTEKSYTIEWYLKNFSIESGNELLYKLAQISENLKIIIKTDEFGAFIEVVNWKDIKKKILKSISPLKKEFKDQPKMMEMIREVQEKYSTKEAIEVFAIDEIQQFYVFHGGKYKINEEIKTKVQVPNMYGGDPFESNIKLWLDEINNDNEYFVIRMHQSVDSDQLTDATYNYLSKIASTDGYILPKREDFLPLTNNTYTASSIHTSGWVIYSVKTKEAWVENTLSFEERTLEIQLKK